MLYFGPLGIKIRWQNALQLKLLLHKAMNGYRFMIHLWEEKVSTNSTILKEKAKIFQIKFRWVTEKKLHALEDS